MERMVCKRLMCGDECNDVYVDVVECCFTLMLLSVALGLNWNVIYKCVRVCRIGQCFILCVWVGVGEKCNVLFYACSWQGDIRQHQQKFIL